MKPLTAANKLGIYLAAAPADFQENMITRSELIELQENPPQWLIDLRTSGPFPKDIVAKKLGVSIAGLARGGVVKALTAGEITALDTELPQWLVVERKKHQEVLAEAQRIKLMQEQRRAASNRPAKNR
ncbi:MAG: DUF5997 family protein [Mycobacteriaceae bacterium]